MSGAWRDTPPLPLSRSGSRSGPRTDAPRGRGGSTSGAWRPRSSAVGPPRTRRAPAKRRRTGACRRVGRARFAAQRRRISVGASAGVRCEMSPTVRVRSVGILATARDVSRQLAHFSRNHRSKPRCDRPTKPSPRASCTPGPARRSRTRWARSRIWVWRVALPDRRGDSFFLSQCAKKNNRNVP